jgi:hypothetical protein
MATPTRDQIIARYKETRDLDDAAAGALADAYLASKGVPAAKPAAKAKAEPVAEKKPTQRTAPAATAKPAAPAPAATAVRAPMGPVAPPPPHNTPDMSKIRLPSPSLADRVASAAEKVAEIPDAAYGAYVSGRRQSAMESANKYRNLDGTKPTIQNFTPAPPPPPPAPGRAPAGMTMSSFSGGVPSTLGARDTSYDARPRMSPEVAARLTPMIATDEVKMIRTAMKKQRPELASQIDQLSDEQVRDRADRVAAQ